MSTVASGSRYSRYTRGFGGVWRLTARGFLVPSQGLGLLALATFVGLLAYTASGPGMTSRFYGWVTDFYILFLVPVLAFISSGGVMRDDLKSTATDYIFTRPLPRALYVAFKFFAHTAVLQLTYLFVLLIALGVAAFRGVPGLLPMAPGLVLTSALVALAAAGFGFFFGALTTRYVAIGLAYAGLVEVGIGKIPTQVGQLSMMRHARTLLEALAESSSSSAGAFGAAVALLVFAALTVGVAALLVHRREFAGERAKDA
jgi:ABC-2 type transport system permease protein